ncbi:cell division protein ZapA [Sphingorhabdus sp. Alg239-R122]|uniref:cell division protein ZapA n=1 Tax=Sphingorhabdus sp. Alg239-R122 TaxID=2305989 RepID=UPI0013DBCDBC|nr:cell division protein ZapA [Sphingorhabdus sp. Alg239-R122]
MPDVSITIADRQFKLTCGEGEEQQLENLGRVVDETARKAGYSSQALTESRMLLFTSLLLADQLDELQNAKGSAVSAPPAPETPHDSIAAKAVEKLARRMEKLASSLEETAGVS